MRILGFGVVAFSFDVLQFQCNFAVIITIFHDIIIGTHALINVNVTCTCVHLKEYS